MINDTGTKKGNSMDLNRQLIEAMADLNEDLVIATVRQMAAEGHSFEEIQQCLNTGISAVGTRFERGDYFIADLIVSGMIYRSALNEREPLRSGGAPRPLGKVVIGVVAGDIHDIGKDIIVFQWFVFPTMLKAHGDYILPDNVPANEFLNLENDKISTSRNWAVWLHEYLVDFPGKQDVLRYVLTANAPETKDNNFTWKDFQDRNNNELVAVYGNFVNRALQLTKKYFNGTVPECGELQDVDRAAIEEFKDVKQKVETLLDAFKFRDAQKEAMNLARIGNKYITDCEPWHVAKTDMERVKTILYISLQLVANLEIAFEPFLPFSSAKLREMLGVAETEWDQLGSTELLKPGHQLGTPALLFEKIEDDAINAQLQKLEDTKKANEAASYVAAPIKENVDFETFEKMDIRVGHIKDCQKVKKSKKLLQFTIDDGSGKDRTILSGIAAYYEPEQLIGKDVLFVANFAPRKMMGIESQGMILSAVNFDGTLNVTSVLGNVKPGSQVG